MENEQMAAAASRTAKPGLGCFVVGWDGSTGARVALEWASELAAATGSTVRVVSCWTLQQVWDHAHRDHPGGGVPSEDELAAVAHRRLVGAVAEIAGPDSGIECVCVHTGEPAEVLAKHSATAGLLFVGARERGPLGSALLGSVSGELLRSSLCPVVVVPPKVIAGRSESSARR